MMSTTLHTSNEVYFQALNGTEEWDARSPGEEVLYASFKSTGIHSYGAQVLTMNASKHFGQSKVNIH